MIRPFLVLLILLIAAPKVSIANPIMGRASVIDGDTLEIHRTRIRLYGIDAPESQQLCTTGSKKWRCGQKAAFALMDKVAVNPVTCEPKGRDRYDRIVALCRIGDIDLSSWMVAEGWALAYRRYSTDYVVQEGSAVRSKVGIWQSNFVSPWDWRQGKRLVTADATPAKAVQPGKCLIKGNISRNGKIYHLPGGQYYGRIRIDTSKGERWFCSEAEATAAGWRRSGR